MPQAENDNFTRPTTNPLTRRTALVLAGASVAATSTAVALPAIAGPADTLSYPDHARQFAAVYERWRTQHAIDKAHGDASDARIKQATGIARCDAPGYKEDDPTGYWNIVRAIAREESGGHVVDDYGDDNCPWKPIHDAIYQVCAEIVRLPARTVADLGLQAQAVALENDHMWTDENEQDSGVVALRLFVENVCQFAGVNPLPGVEVVPVQDDDEDGGSHV